MEKYSSAAHFGALEVAHFERDLFETGGEDRKRGNEVGVAIALNHLRGHRCRAQTQLGADRFLDLGADVGEGADGARDLADAHVLRGGFQPLNVAARLFVPDGKFQTEGDGFGMDAVCAADLHRVLEFERAALEDGTQPFEIGQQDRRRLADLQRLRGVDDVI